MEAARTRNDLGAALVKFCLALEAHRRTPEGRVRNAAQFLSHFFPTDGDGGPNDRVFAHMPKEIRGPILSGWGIRGAKAALRDDDAKVATVVADALAAGDLDADAFETALSPETLLAWVPLASFWTFWRAGAIGKPTLLLALTTAYELRLLDGRAFFETMRARGGELQGTDVLGTALNKDELIEWIRKLHASGDASPKGMLEAVGWDKIVQKAPTEALLGVLDALAVRVGLAAAPEQPTIAQSSQPTRVSPAAATHDADGHTPAGAAVAIESPPPNATDPNDAVTGENASKTDPPPAGEAEILVETGDEIASAAAGASSSDLAKTGPYASPPARPNPVSAPRLPKSDEDEDSAEETKLYRPAQRR